MIEVWCDGACEPKNPGGWGGYGAVIRKDGETVQEISGLIQRAPEVSNNVAEYRALMAALSWLAVQGFAEESIVVRGDSKLVIEQMFGRWKIKGGFYAPLARQCKTLVGRFPRIRGQWVPREQNGLADELSKRELLRAGVKFRIQPEEALVAEPPAGPRARHSWEKTDVEVPWQAHAGHLYVCRLCCMKRQSVPSGRFFVQEFTSREGRVSRGKTPPCAAVQPALDQQFREAMEREP